MIILVGEEKGGVGKTTAAVNLAVWRAKQGRDVLLVDADPQPSASKWALRRSRSEVEPKIHCVQKTGDIYDSLFDLKDRYQDLIIDTGGRDSEELRSALLATDILLMPLKPSTFNLETTPHMLKLCNQASKMNRKLRCILFFNEVATHHLSSEKRESIGLIQELPGIEIVEILDECLYSRKAFRECEDSGLSVIEYKDEKAAFEMNKLAKKIFAEVE